MVAKFWNFLSNEKKIYYYNILLSNDTTTKYNGKALVPFLLYKEIHSTKVKCIDTNLLVEGEVFSIPILHHDNNKISVIKIAKADLSNKYKTLNENLLKGMANIIKCKKESMIRQKDGQSGNMYAFGEYASYIDKKIHIYKDSNIVDVDLLPLISSDYSKLMEDHFPAEVSTLRAHRNSYNEIVPSIMGGEEGITKSMNCSINLINPPHFDARDLGISLSLWTCLNEEENLSEWSFILPSVYSERENETFYGVKIRLSHGALIVWDGRYDRHCSALDQKESNNYVFGWQIANNLDSLNSYKYVHGEN